ncbi:MAG: hypothetical protein K2M29_05955 [Paramuribaculum sp.]|nr:hypothetical protein [Paramuribaculum sp.]
MPSTSIMATLTYSQCTPEFLSLMTSRGMQGVRINSAHVTGSQMADMCSAIRSAAPTAVILTDTKGAEVRTTDAPIPVEFLEGDTTVALYAPDRITTREAICLNAPDLGRYLRPGQLMTIDDGALRFTIEAIEENTDEQYTGFADRTRLRLRAINSGILGPRKSVNFPGIDLPHLPSVTEKDREAILAAPAAGVNIIAHSFVRTAADVEAVREVLRSATDDNSYPSDILVYAKIECRMALDHLDEIMDAADGILFARGDLGAAVPIEQIPVIQQQVMDRATRRGLPVILSTQILQSMLSSDTPTRAEVTDMYLGVIQGASWMLLCGETAQGNYPAECIDIMRRTIDATTTFFPEINQ